MKAHIKLEPGDTPRISLGGQVFGGKLFARGEALQGTNGDIQPQAVVSIVNLDLNSVAKAFPDLKSVQPSGKVTATANISENLNVAGKITSDRLSASGVTVNKLQANLNYDNTNSRAGGRITAGSLSTNGITLTKLLADLNYNIKGNDAEISTFRTNLGTGQITASGKANVKDGIFSVKAEANDIDTQAIPGLQDLAGKYRLTASASGNYTDINSINANANFAGRNIAYAGTPIGSISLPVSYANNRVNIPRAVAVIPGGMIDLWGTADLKNTANPMLNLALSTTTINLAKIIEAYNIDDSAMPISGVVVGNFKITGPLKSALVNANIYANEIKAGEIVDMPNAAIEVDGSTKRINIRRIAADVNRARIQGHGDIRINQQDIMKSAMNAFVEVRGFNLKKTLQDLKVDVPLSGIIDGYVEAKGTLSTLGVDAKVSTITYKNDINFDDIRLKARAPKENDFLINASARVDEFKPEVDAELKKIDDKWFYFIDTRPIDLDTLMSSKLVNVPDVLKGLVNVSIRGDTGNKSPVAVNASANEITVIDKLRIQDISIPVIYRPSNNTIVMRNGRALLSNGNITTNADVDLDKSKWDGNLEVKHLNFGKLAEPFMPMGQLVGSVDVNVIMTGGFGVMPLSFANGKFETTPGYLHKIDILDKISNGRISFEKISGTFFWNGEDLYLNPGTGARADNKEPLYRYFNISGPMGIPGEGLSLKCDGRFDLKVLDQLLGAMKGLFQYMTGGLTQSVLRDAVSRVLGVKSRDFQNVSFTLSNSWQNLGLDDLKITKSIEDFLPINILNQDEEKQKEEAQFKMSLKFPVGPGDKSVEEESTEDQLKQQFIDNLFNISW